MGPDQFLYVIGTFAVELDQANKANQDASQKALAELSGTPEPGSLRECELLPLVQAGDFSSPAIKNGKSELHNLFDLASTMAKKTDGTVIRNEQFNSIFDADTAKHLNNNSVEKIRQAGNATVISLVNPIIKGDGSGNSITFGQRNSNKAGARYEFSLTPVSNSETVELMVKGVNADTLLGQIPVSSISLHPREGGNISFEVHTDFGSKRGCAFAATGREVLEK